MAVCGGAEGTDAWWVYGGVGGWVFVGTVVWQNAATVVFGENAPLGHCMGHSTCTGSIFRVQSGGCSIVW